MSDRSNVIDLVYQYDGSFEGFLTCVFESISSRENPLQIAVDPPQSLLYRQRLIETDPEKAFRVYRSIGQKISPAAEEAVRHCFLSCLADKETALLEFLRLGYKAGGRVTDMLQDKWVHTVLQAAGGTAREAHLLKGFIRFSARGGTLAAVIGPKNFVLPLLAPHFAARLPEERFFIYDETHGAGLLYQPHTAKIFPVEDFRLPPPDAEEACFRNLWRRFYDTIAVEGRENPRCRMNMMPKRYWRYMTEFQPPIEHQPPVEHQLSVES